jgi:ABC-type transport system substrate-binding protein
MSALRVRRRRRAAATAASVIAVALLAAACNSGKAATASGGNGSSGSPAGAGSSAGGSATGGDNGTVNWEWELPTSWDPVTSSAGWDVHVLSLVYSSITRLDAKGVAGPGVASSWKYAADGKSVTFTIRPNLKFSDGTPLDAEAVKENILRGRDTPKSNIASQLADISDVKVLSPTSVELDLSTLDYQLPNRLAGKTGQLVSPTAFKTDAAGLATKPVGAGPFMLTSYVPDSHADLVRDPSYWDAADIHLAKFSVQSITDPQQILAALESGQVNVAAISGTQVKTAKAAGFNVDVIPALPVVELDVKTSVAPYNNPKVVDALNYAIDRQALLQAQQFGYGAVSYQPFPQGYVGYDPKLANLYPHDVAKAKQLLKEAGYPNGLSITLTSSSTEDSLAEQIQSEVKDAGINVTIKDIPADTSTQAIYINKTVPLAVDGTAGRESPLQMLQVLYDQKGLMNATGLTATEPASVTAAFNAVQAVPLDSPKYQSTLLNAVDTAVKDEPVHIWLYYTPRILAVSPKVTGLPFDLVQQRFEGVRVAG